MNHQPLSAFSNWIENRLSVWKKLPRKRKAKIFEQNTKKKISTILEEKNIECLSTDSIFNSILTKTGYQFCLRATVSEYTKWKYLPSWDSWTDWTHLSDIPNFDNSSIHFYTWNTASYERAIEGWYWVDEILKNTIRSCIEQYARNHFGKTFETLSKHGLYQKENLPVLYIFWASEDIIFKDRYKWFFAFHEDKPTFYESSITQRIIKSYPNTITINPDFIFRISYEEYLEINKKVRAQIIANYDNIIREVSDKKYTLKDTENPKFRLFINGVNKFQKAFENEINTEHKVKQLTLKEEKILKEKDEELLRVFINAQKIIAVWNFYDKHIYEEFSELMWMKVKNSFIN